MKSILLFSRRLRRKLLSRGTSCEDADDLIQEAFLRFETYSRKQPVQDAQAFVARTALNLAVDQHRRKRIAPFEQLTEGTPEIAAESAEPDEVWAAQERLHRLNAGLAALSERTRTILLAQRVDGLSYSEIARMHGISVSAVEKHIARAMLFLREWMAE
jgi:RNA polymerase sigma-70 factor (ECF subfamily)